MKWNIKDWHANYYYNITAILQQQARVPISSVPILNFFQLICRIEIHRTLISCNLQKCALEQVQVADEQLGRSETKHFYRLQGRRVRLFISPTLQIRISYWFFLSLTVLLLQEIRFTPFAEWTENCRYYRIERMKYEENLTRKTVR